MDTINEEDLLFYITKEDVQYEALEKIGRKLTEDELEFAKEGLEWGILESIWIIYNTVFYEMIPN